MVSSLNIHLKPDSLVATRRDNNFNLTADNGIDPCILSLKALIGHPPAAMLLPPVVLGNYNLFHTMSAKKFLFIKQIGLKKM